VDTKKEERKKKERGRGMVREEKGKVGRKRIGKGKERGKGR